MTSQLRRALAWTIVRVAAFFYDHGTREGRRARKDWKQSHYHQGRSGRS